MLEGYLAIIMDMINCYDIPNALSIITTMSGDQATISKLKGDLEKERKISS